MVKRKLTRREGWLLGGIPIVLIAVAHHFLVVPVLRDVDRIQGEIEAARRTSPPPATLAVEFEQVEESRQELQSLQQVIAGLEQQRNEAIATQKQAHATPAALTDAWCRHLKRHGLVIGAVSSGAGTPKPGGKDVELHFSGSWTNTMSALRTSDVLPGGWLPAAFRMNETAPGATNRTWCLTLSIVEGRKR